MNEANIPLKNFPLLCTQQSPLSQELLQTILVGLGADVCMARDAAELIDKLPGNYTAILTDLPDSGQETNQYIFRIRQKVPETPIVVVGQYQSFEGYIRCGFCSDLPPSAGATPFCVPRFQNLGRQSGVLGVCPAKFPPRRPCCADSCRRSAGLSRQQQKRQEKCKHSSDNPFPIPFHMRHPAAARQ